MRGRSKDKDGAAGKERKAGEKVIFPAMLQDFRMIQLRTVDRQMDVEYVSLSLISKHHPYCARLPRPLTQSQCPCRRQTPH